MKLSKRSKYLAFIVSTVLTVSCVDNYNKKEIYKSDRFTLFPDKVVQDTFEAKALSPTEIVSNYKSNYSTKISPRISFKFSINGKDNELPSGVHHSLVILPNEEKEESVTIKFGTPYTDETSVPENIYLSENAKINIKLDLRAVFKAFDEDGFYTNFNGVKIYKEDFGKIYIAGNVEPLLWDFDNLVNHPELEMKDEDGDGIYDITLVFNKPAEQRVNSSWKLSKDISSYPTYTSPYLIMDALHNMSLEEMKERTGADSTFKIDEQSVSEKGRNLSYSIVLSMAALQPEIAKKSLMQLVEKHRIIQDIGTGGSYPVSTDRVIWAAAAWEIYKVTGDRGWLKESYEIIKNTIEDDRLNIFDPNTGLMRGESSFLNWREQTYPKWMQPVDIYESMSLSTNVVHFHASKVLSLMAQKLQDLAGTKKYQGWADSLQKNINKHLWLTEKGYYAQYLYGRVNKISSERSDALGEALAVLFDVADGEQQSTIVAKTPILNYGISSIFPQTTFIPSYQNNAIWPFTQSYWTMAAAKVFNEQATIEGLASIYRPAALFLTNKENFRADSGDWFLTQTNSDKALWSLSGNLALVYKVLFGLNFESDGLRIKPYVPKVLRGERKLKNFKYRDAILDITLTGYGNAITSVTVDGNEQTEAYIDGKIKGKHEIIIVLSDNQIPKGDVNLVPNKFALDMPALSYNSGKLKWRIVEGAKTYKVLKNGEAHNLVENYEIDIPQNEFAEYQVIAIDTSGVESFASAPYMVSSPGLEQLVEMESIVKPSSLSAKGYSGKGFIEVSLSMNDSLVIPINILDTGIYAIDFKYANGNGYIGMGDNCAMRTLEVDNEFLGTIVFPQRGKNEWSDWGFSNKVVVHLNKGEQHLKLIMKRPTNYNMNGVKNNALIDYARIIKVK